MSKLLRIDNQGQMIAWTNYWSTEQALAGYLYLSFNAGAYRLLLPESRRDYLREMKGASEVIISRGLLEGQEALELLFEDCSDSPFCIHLNQASVGVFLNDASQGAGLALTVWMESGQKLRLPARYRRVETLPCLEPWTSH